jgi:hypothetical protein
MPPAPAALTMTYRGPLGPIEIDAVCFGVEK